MMSRVITIYSDSVINGQVAQQSSWFGYPVEGHNAIAQIVKDLNVFLGMLMKKFNLEPSSAEMKVETLSPQEQINYHLDSLKKLGFGKSDIPKE